MGYGSVLPEISPAGEVIPQVGVGHLDGPGDEIADQEQEEQSDQAYGIVFLTGYVFVQASVTGSWRHSVFCSGNDSVKFL